MTKTREEVLSKAIDLSFGMFLEDKNSSIIYKNIKNHCLDLILNSSLFTVELPKEKEYFDIKENKGLPTVVQCEIYQKNLLMNQYPGGYNQALQEVRQSLEKQGFVVKESEGK